MIKRISCLIILAAISIIILLTGCNKENIHNFVIINKSSDTINSIAVQRGSQTDVMGSELEPNQKCYFDMGIQDNYTFVIEFEDVNKQIIHSKEITADFNYNKDEVKNIKISKDNNKEWSITLEN